MDIPLLTVQVKFEHDVVLARRRARRIAALLSFEAQDQIRIATAVSELARNAFQYAGGGTIAFGLSNVPVGRLTISVTDKGTGIDDVDAILDGRYQSQSGLGLGLRGARRLMDGFTVRTAPHGTVVAMAKALPKGAGAVTGAMAALLVTQLTQEPPESPFEEMQGHNQELLAALEEVQSQKDEMDRLNIDLAAALAQAHAASQAKSDFLATMSHEVRTPMNAVVGITELLARTGLTDKQARYVSILNQSATTMASLINGLLDIGKIEDNKIELEHLPFDLGEVMDRVVAIGSVAAAGKAVVVSYRGDGCPTAYVGDAQRLQQILLNLVSNAVKFTEAGSVAITAAEVGRDGDLARLSIRITDTGIGISPDALDRIFDRYVQADASTTRRFGGSGLGLPIARSLAQLMGGSLTVQSEVGKGSTFIVALELQAG